MMLMNSTVIITANTNTNVVIYHHKIVSSYQSSSSFGFGTVFWCFFTVISRSIALMNHMAKHT